MIVSLLHLTGDSLQQGHSGQNDVPPAKHHFFARVKELFLRNL
jgi:hypothetical protein